MAAPASRHRTLRSTLPTGSRPDMAHCGSRTFDLARRCEFARDRICPGAPSACLFPLPKSREQTSETSEARRVALISVAPGKRKRGLAKAVAGRTLRRHLARHQLSIEINDTARRRRRLPSSPAGRLLGRSEIRRDFEAKTVRTNIPGRRPWGLGMRADGDRPGRLVDHCFGEFHGPGRPVIRAVGMNDLGPRWLRALRDDRTARRREISRRLLHVDQGRIELLDGGQGAAWLVVASAPGVSEDRPIRPLIGAAPSWSAGLFWRSPTRLGAGSQPLLRLARSRLRSRIPAATRLTSRPTV